ncbi:hypothetical protein QJS10_CPB12g00382 [Acorus calamus]|uniref:Wall-associated receptor kinase galacturonan-binding domain-containing protein n=1 Tax=Acorus calamus TaxID=4465 RepID=A0AAV9DMS1_ACOCL|nr:hypothetical protein QJS10_CPB12g00382 [Acorus calamus]
MIIIPSKSPMALLPIPTSTSFIFFFFFSSSLNTHTLSAQTCPPPSMCGNISIHYPFWLNSSTTNTSSYCGYPGFGLTCNNKHPILHFLDMDYYIVVINYATYTITLVDIDVYDQTCPRPRHNFTNDRSLNFFRKTPNDMNLTFFFNCSTQFKNFQPTPLSCLPNSYVIPTDLYSVVKNWYSYCKEAVMLPALSDYVNLSELGKNFGQVLIMGLSSIGGPRVIARRARKAEGPAFTTNRGVSLVVYAAMIYIHKIAQEVRTQSKGRLL